MGRTILKAKEQYHPEDVSNLCQNGGEWKDIMIISTESSIYAIRDRLKNGICRG